MYLSSSDGVNDGNVDENSQTRQGNTPSVTSAVCKIYLDFVSSHLIAKNIA